MLPVATGSHGSGTYLIQLYDHGCRQCLVARVGAQTIESAAHSTDSLDSHHSLTYSSAVLCYQYAPFEMRPLSLRVD